MYVMEIRGDYEIDMSLGGDQQYISVRKRTAYPDHGKIWSNTPSAYTYL